jgi:hypothetical protein
MEGLSLARSHNRTVLSSEQLIRLVRSEGCHCVTQTGCLCSLHVFKIDLLFMSNASITPESPPATMILPYVPRMRNIIHAKPGDVLDQLPRLGRKDLHTRSGRHSEKIRLHTQRVRLRYRDVRYGRRVLRRVESQFRRERVPVFLLRGEG